MLALFLRRCAYCGALFGICPKDDRGHAYCEKVCRIAARRAYLRRSRAVHQRSPLGRLDQRDRMRSYRRSLRGRVMEHPSEKLAQSEIVHAAEHARDIEVVSVDLPVQRDDDAASLVCGDSLGASPSSDTGEDPNPPSSPGDSEPAITNISSATATTSGVVGRATTTAFYCVVCGRIGDRYLVGHLPNSRRRKGDLDRRSGRGSRDVPLRR